MGQAGNRVAAEDEIGGDGFGEHLGDEELSNGSGGIDTVLEQKLRKRNRSLNSLEISNVSPLEIKESLNEGGAGSVVSDGLLEVHVSVEPCGAVCSIKCGIDSSKDRDAGDWVGDTLLHGQTGLVEAF